jgi:hypothetical protein
MDRLPASRAENWVVSSGDDPVNSVDELSAAWMVI